MPQIAKPVTVYGMSFKSQGQFFKLFGMRGWNMTQVTQRWGSLEALVRDKLKASDDAEAAKLLKQRCEEMGIFKPDDLTLDDRALLTALCINGVQSLDLVHWNNLMGTNYTSSGIKTLVERFISSLH